MFSMQNFELESAVISVSSNSALIEKYLRNTCLGQSAVPTIFPNDKHNIIGLYSCTIICVIINCKYVLCMGIYTDLHRSTLSYITPYLMLASLT